MQAEALASLSTKNNLADLVQAEVNLEDSSLQPATQKLQWPELGI